MTSVIWVGYELQLDDLTKEQQVNLRPLLVGHKNRIVLQRQSRTAVLHINRGIFRKIVTEEALRAWFKKRQGKIRTFRANWLHVDVKRNIAVLQGHVDGLCLYCNINKNCSINRQHIKRIMSLGEINRYPVNYKISCTAYQHMGNIF